MTAARVGRVGMFARAARVATVGVVAVLALAGCASRGGPVPTPLDAEGIAARERQLASLERFSVSGGFGYWDDRQNLSADIDWRRDGRDLAIRLRAPLGLGGLDVEQGAGGARVSRNGGAPLIGPQAAPLLARALGLSAPVPLEQLGRWILGLPGAQATQVRRDELGRLQALVYRDASGALWRASVRRYREVDGWWLPALLTAVSGERHLKLALSDWRLPARKAGDPADASTSPTPAALPAGEPAVSPATSPAGRRLSLPGA